LPPYSKAMQGVSLGSTRGTGDTGTLGQGSGAQSASTWMTGFAESIRARAWARGEVGPADGAAWCGTDAGAGPTVHNQHACDAPGTGAVLQSTQPRFHFGRGPFDQNKLHIFELNLKISEYKSCKPSSQLQHLQRAIYVKVFRLARIEHQRFCFSRLVQEEVLSFD
jgi:hypothetical protein